MKYYVKKIPKSKHKYRTIYIVSESNKIELKGYLNELEEIHKTLDRSKVSFAFLKDKNCALLASKHIGYKYTLSLDLEDFFDSCTENHLKDRVPSFILKKCLINGAPRQGLPTSPLLSSIAFLETDQKIVDLIKWWKDEIVYSRYADDLIFSFNNKMAADFIFGMVVNVITSAGFRINERKIKLQPAENGRRKIVGISVGGSDIRPTRKTKKKIRAALHQKNMMSYLGLCEWAKCSLPSSDRVVREFFSF